MMPLTGPEVVLTVTGCADTMKTGINTTNKVNINVFFILLVIYSGLLDG